MEYEMNTSKKMFLLRPWGSISFLFLNGFRFCFLFISIIQLPFQLNFFGRYDERLKVREN